MVSRWQQAALPPQGNPMVIRAQSEDVLWERTVDVLHEYHFNIERENRVARVIETTPRVGSNVAELWHRDSVGLANRLESTLQSIQRRVVVTFIPGDGPGVFSVDVQALKEKLDSYDRDVQSAGGATFLESEPLSVDLDPVIGTSTPRGFISLGRDPALETALLRSLRAAYGR
ncbi:MAG: hypothetical protein ACK5Q5_14850 [Planctomycetaceae bacterium]